MHKIRTTHPAGHLPNNHLPCTALPAPIHRVSPSAPKAPSISTSCNLASSPSDLPLPASPTCRACAPHRTASHRITDIGNRHVYMSWWADPLSSCQPTTLPTDPCTYLLECLPTCLPTCLATYLTIHLVVHPPPPTQLSTYPTTYLLTYPTFSLPPYPHTHHCMQERLFLTSPGERAVAARFPVNIPRNKGKTKNEQFC